MKFALTSALLAVTLTLGCGGVAVAQAPKPKPAQAKAVDPFDAAIAAYDRKDYATAASLFRSLAAQGDASAQNNLGLMYANGNGVAQDYVRAHMWYNLGASSLSGENGKKATSNRDNVAAKMTPAQIAQAQAMARKCQASNFKQCD